MNMTDGDSDDSDDEDGEDDDYGHNEVVIKQESRSREKLIPHFLARLRKFLFLFLIFKTFIKVLFLFSIYEILKHKSRSLYECNTWEDFFFF